MICKKCNSKIDDKAVICVHCGAKTKNYRKQLGKKRFYQRWWFYLILAFICFFLIGVFNEDAPVDNSAQAEDFRQETTAATEDVVETEAATDAESEQTEPVTTEPEVTEPEVIEYKSGMYKVGVDIEPGEYFVTNKKGSLAYVEVCSDSSGKFDSIVTNENVSTFFFITVIDGQYLKVKKASFVNAEHAITPAADESGNYQEGMYRVGIDIPAGEYKINTRPGDSIYYEVLTDSSGDFSSIVTNGHSKDPVYITIEAGQYFKLIDGTFSFQG